MTQFATNTAGVGRAADTAVSLFPTFLALVLFKACARIDRVVFGPAKDTEGNRPPICVL